MEITGSTWLLWGVCGNFCSVAEVFDHRYELACVNVTSILDTQPVAAPGLWWIWSGGRPGQDLNLREGTMVTSKTILLFFGGEANCVEGTTNAPMPPPPLPWHCHYPQSPQPLFNCNLWNILNSHPVGQLVIHHSSFYAWYTFKIWWLNHPKLTH